MAQTPLHFQPGGMNCLYQNINSTLWCSCSLEWITCIWPKSQIHQAGPGESWFFKVYNWGLNLLSLCVSPGPPLTKYQILMSELFYLTSDQRNIWLFFSLKISLRTAWNAAAGRLVDKGGQTEGMTVLTAFWKIRGAPRRQHAAMTSTTSNEGRVVV